MARFWPGGATLRVERFEVTTLAWRAPAEVLFIRGAGAGGGGAGGHTADPGGGGGGGSPGWAVDFAPVSVAPGALLDITIGSPSAGAAPGAAPANGNATLVTGLRDGIEGVTQLFRLQGGGTPASAGTATNGGNGAGVNSFGPGAVGGTGAGPQGTIDTFSLRGLSLTIGRGGAGGGPSSAGAASTGRMYATAPTGGAATGTQGGGAAGGYGPFGRGGPGGNGGAPGSPATGFGAGGGGGGCLAAGGAGAPGFIEIMWFE